MDSIEEMEEEVKSEEGEKKSCFVTGGSGFVGYNLLLQLLKDDQWVVTCMTFEGDKDILKKRLLDLYDENKGKLHLVNGNILKVESIRKCMPEDLDCVFHVAGSIAMYSKLNKLQYDINVNGTKNVLEVAIEKKVKRFIHTSSTSVYKPQEPSKKDELITETSYKGALERNFHYGQTKYLGESLVLEAIKKGLINAIIIQPNFILGEHDILGNGFSRLFNKVYRKTLPFVTMGGGSFADVREVTRAMISAFRNGKEGECYILGGEFMMHRDLVIEIGKQLKMQTKEVPIYVPPFWIFYSLAWIMECGSICCSCGKKQKKQPKITIQQVMSTSRIVNVDSSKATKELGYKFTPIKELVKKQIEYMKKNGLFEYDL